MTAVYRKDLGMTPPRAWMRSSDRPLIIGHRGASALAPENSLEAFARAGRDGADGVELDVLLCATGEVVVFHDDDLVRLGGRPERVGDLTWAALREVTLTSGARIPTLAEALDVCGPMLVNVELKAEGLLDPRVPELVEAVADVLAETGAAPRVLVSSFNPLALFHSKRHMPDVPIGLLFEREAPLPLRGAWSTPLLRPFALHPEHVLCTPEAIARWRSRGVAINTWTVDAPERLRALRDMGVDGIITNDPAAARAAVG